MAVVPGTRLGPYEVLGPLGAGGMAELYRARDTRLGRFVAIKTLPAEIAQHPVRRARLQREAQALSAMNHRHVCALYDIGEHEGLLFLVMELVDGQPLNVALRRGPLPRDQVLRIGIELADALEEAHGRGLIHRDLKPSNIMLTASGVKLLDFGLARPCGGLLDEVSEQDLTTAALTMEGQLLGTVVYMAPEQLQAGPLDGRTDLFALGVVLYEMLSGQRPFEGTSVASRIAEVLTREPAPLTGLSHAPAVPAVLDHVVQRCLAKSPNDRWQTARDVRLELEWIAKPWAGGDPPRTPRRPEAARLPGLRAPLAVALAAFAVLVVLGAVASPLFVSTHERPASLAPVPLRFAVPPPDGTQFQAAGHFMAISPDGRHLAFIGTSGGVRMLWLRDLTGLESRPVAGSEGASQPFWSPDSRSVAFFDEGGLKKVDIEGGRPELIASVRDGLAGSWSVTGDILFQLGGDHELQRIPAGGGPPQPATVLATARREIRHSSPHFLPDGRHFLYLAVSQDDGQTGVFVDALDEQRPMRVLSGKTNAAYTAPGYLLWHHEGRLLAQAFDTARLAPAGEPSTVTENVLWSPTSGRASFSVSNTGTLVFMPGPIGRLAWYDRRGFRQGFVGEPGEFDSPALSPDARHLAVSKRDPAHGTSHIWVYDLSDGSGVPFTRPQASGTMPLWSADGTDVLFASSRAGTSGLLVQPYPGPSVDRPASPIATDVPGQPAAFTRDGRHAIVESSGPESRRFRSGVLDLATGKVAPLLDQPPHNYRFVQLSRDGRWLAYASDESGRSEIYVETLPRGGGKWMVSHGGGVEPRWRADGAELFYLSLSGMIVAVPVESRAPFRAGPPAVLFATRLTATISPGLLGRNQYDVTPDGARFLIREMSPSALTLVAQWPFLLREARQEGGLAQRP